MTLLAFGITSSSSPAWAAKKTKTCADGDAIECIQDTLGPVPVAPEDQDIQQQIDGLGQQNDDILDLLCGLVGPSPICGGVGELTVFVTSSVHQGDFSGLLGGDAICNGLAQGAGLPGTYLAWLSDDLGNSPNTRFTPSAFPYVLVALGGGPGGPVVAADYPDLTSLILLHPIDRDENGDPFQTTDFVWTGTKPAGDVVAIGLTCTNWSSQSLQVGFAGRADQTDGSWTQFGQPACDARAHLYCFQQ